MSKTTRIDWQPILLEAAFVVLGVFLALAANEWRENEKREWEAEELLAMIGDEVAQNHSAVSRSVAYHGQIVFALNSARERPAMDLFTGGFISLDEPRSNAWDMALAADAIRFMPVEAALQITTVYKAQDNYLRDRDAVGQLLFEKIFAEGTGGVLDNYANHAQILGSFLYLECGLLVDYGAALEAMGHSSDLEPPVSCTYLPDRE